MHIMNEATEEVMVSIGKTIGDVIVALKPVIDLAVQAILGFAKAWEDTEGPLSWIQDHWPAIKAVWAEITLILSEVFAPVKPIWEAVWGAIESVLSGVFSSIGKSIQTFVDGIKTVVGWIGDIAKAIPGVSNAIQQIGFVWDEETKKITASKAALEAKKEAEEAAIATSKKLEQANKRAAEGEVQRANAAKAAAEAVKKAAAENEKLANKWEANDKAFRESQKKNEDAFTKAYYSMKKESVETVEIIVSQWDRMPPAIAKSLKLFQEAEFSLKALGVTSESELKQAATDATNWANKVEEAFLAGKTSAANYSAALEAAEAKQKALVDYTNRDLIGAYKALGVTSQATLQQTATDAEAAYAKIKASGTASTGDLYLAMENLKKAQQAVVDHADREMTDAYHNLGVKSAAEMHTLATEAESAYQKIARDAGDNSVAAKTAWITKTQEAYADILAQGGTLTTGQKNELDRAKTMLDNHLEVTKSAWQTTYDGVKGAVSGAMDSLIEKLVTGKGSFQEILTTMWQDIASAALHSFIDPVTKEIAHFIATTLADLIGGKGLGGVLDSLKSIGEAAEGVFKGASSSVPSVPSVPGAPSIPGGGPGGAAGAVAGMGMQAIVGMVTGIVSAISGVIGNFQMAHMETSLNAIEHNTRYTMMYVGERADGGILGISFRIFEEIAYGTLPKAMEKHRDQFFDWTGFVNPIFETIRNNVMDSYPVLVDMRGVLYDIRAMVSDVAGTARGNADLLREINVSIVAQGITTAEAARALGDQIASNLKGQMVAA
jgi:phage-related protein